VQVFLIQLGFKINKYMCKPAV